MCFVAKDKPEVSSDELSDALTTWFSWHDQKSVPPPVLAASVAEYRRLSQEGVQKKSNRLARYELLEKYSGI